MDDSVGEKTNKKLVITSDEFGEAWFWLINFITVNQRIISQHEYFLDHKHWKQSKCLNCVDEFVNSDLFLARLYLICHLSSVNDYLQGLKIGVINFNLFIYGSQLDEDIARVIKAEENNNNTNSFRNSLSESLSFWALLASIIKKDNFVDFSIMKPNLQPEDKGQDGIACIISSDSIEVKLVSIKNSINSPKSLLSSASFRKGDFTALERKKVFDEFLAFERENVGFQRLDEKLDTILQSINHEKDPEIRALLLQTKSQYNASIVANEKHLNEDLFEGFNKISDKPERRIGIYIGSRNWTDLGNRVQIKVKEILTDRGISF